MLVAITVIHIIITLSLIGLVLLQDPKGGAMGGLMGGGGSQSVFGATGASNFLTTATKWVAVAFGITCITLTYFTSHRERSVTDDLVPTSAAAPTTSPIPAAAQDPAAGAGPGAGAAAPAPEKVPDTK